MQLLVQTAAEEALQYALQHCARDAEPNKIRIMYFLVPVKMLLGEVPSQAALQKYKLSEYAAIVQVISGCTEWHYQWNACSQVSPSLPFLEV